MFRFFIKHVLRLLARWTIKKYHPRIVGITGSVGKTGTKEAVAQVLSTKFQVGQTPKNLNNEIGLPLAILREHDSGYGSLFLWLGIISRAIKNLIITRESYPEVLVLEYGVDHKGDIDYLVKIARPNIAIVTAVAPTHLEFLGTVEDVAREKGKLVKALPQRGVAILSADDARVLNMENLTRARVITYGLSDKADINGANITLNWANDTWPRGIIFKLNIQGKSLPIFIPNVVGNPPVTVTLAAVACAIAMDISILNINDVLQKMPLPPGRLRLISGIKNSLLIDDTYNSSPRSAGEALQALSLIEPKNFGKRFAVLGDMLELGKQSEKLHREIGSQVANLPIDYLVAVGAQARHFIHGAVEGGFSQDHTFHFDKSEQAGKFIQDKMGEGDVILIKGSQGVRCEKITKELMAEPARAKELLVRQYKPWV
ncbi:MAG: UDP-N-acetylmuramoyl-tripeptide--D-alanyl-D-alanine ligase [Patescibacteria group bacterium]